MAEEYLAEIRSLQPDGPYYLGGHSAGGLVAFEMARRLREAGQPVALVALFDTWVPGHGEVIPEKLLWVKLSQWRLRISRFSQRLQEGSKLGYLREKLAVRIRVLLGRASTLPPELQEIRDAIERASEDYRPCVYAGAVTLFRATEQPQEIALDETLGWADLASGGVQVLEVPGYHGEIVDEPQAEILAELLRERLDRAVVEAGQTAPPARAAS
jgi:thioesterase domain-containing protein